MSGGSCLSRHDCWLSWEEQDGEEFAVLNFSDDLISQLGWEEGDELDWTQNDNGSISIARPK
jgi:hypothetical protein